MGVIFDYHLYNIEVIYFINKSLQYWQEFLDNVTTVGLQTQYEAVTENLSLIGYLIQSELPVDQHNWTLTSPSSEVEDCDGC